MSLHGTLPDFSRNPDVTLILRVTDQMVSGQGYGRSHYTHVNGKIMPFPLLLNYHLHNLYHLWCGSGGQYIDHQLPVCLQLSAGGQTFQR